MTEGKGRLIRLRENSRGAGVDNYLLGRVRKTSKTLRKIRRQRGEQVGRNLSYCKTPLAGEGEKKSLLRGWEKAPDGKLRGWTDL